MELILYFDFSPLGQKSDADDFEEKDKNKSIRFNSPFRIGYFISKNFAFGLDLDVSLYTDVFIEDEPKYFHCQFSGGPFIRYYILSSRIHPFFEIGSQFSWGRHKMDYSDNTTNDYNQSYTILSYGEGVGFAIPLGHKVDFDILAGYSSRVIRELDDNPDNNRNITGTLGFKMGFTIYIGSH